jgi:hypothetical protein
MMTARPVRQVREQSQGHQDDSEAIYYERSTSPRGLSTTIRVSSLV